MVRGREPPRVATKGDDVAEEVPYGRRIRDLAAAGGDEVALTFAAADGTEHHLTWRDVDTRSDRVAHALADLGARLGDRVGIELRNSPELVLATMGSWKLGATPVPMRWDLPEWERSRLVDALDARVIVGASVVPSFGKASSSVTLTDPIPPHSWGICSSGTTGAPKVIMNTRPGVYDADLVTPFAAEWGPVETPQVVLGPAPIYHTNGFSAVTSMLNGDRLVLMEKFDAGRVVDLVERHRVTTFTATPTMLQRIARLPGVDKRDFSSIRWILQGAAVIPPSLVQTWIGLVGAEHFIMAYGMTEQLGLTALRGDEWLHHRGSVGRPIRGAEILIIDSGGQPAGVGETGEIYLRSPTSEFFAYQGGTAPLPATEGGYRTAGDLGWLDEDGYLYIADRRVDMIISGGANVYPAEVENALIDHPRIADVVVVGLSDDEWGHRVHAIVEPADRAAPPSSAEVIAWAKDRLAAYKVPKTVEVVDAIPRSEATKVSRSALVAERGG